MIISLLKIKRKYQIFIIIIRCVLLIKDMIYCQHNNNIMLIIILKFIIGIFGFYLRNLQSFANFSKQQNSHSGIIEDPEIYWNWSQIGIDATDIASRIRKNQRNFNFGTASAAHQV